MGWTGGVGASRPAIRGDQCGSKFVSTAREDKCGPGEIGIPRIGIIRAGSKPRPCAADSPDSEDMYSRLERFFPLFESRHASPQLGGRKASGSIHQQEKFMHIAFTGFTTTPQSAAANSRKHSNIGGLA